MTLVSTWFAISSVVAFAICGLHVVVGGRESVPPLLAADIHPVAKYTNYYCWHLVSLTLFAMGVCFGVAAFNASSWQLAAATTLLSASFALWSLILIFWKKQPWQRLPQWCLFLPLTIFGTLGFFL